MNCLAIWLKIIKLFKIDSYYITYLIYIYCYDVCDLVRP